jgi:membrane fusion protein (multidrug efflux system)
MRAWLLIGILALTGCSGGSKDEGGPDKVTLVRTVAVQTADMTQYIEAYGLAEIAPSGERTVTAPADSVVQALFVAAGDQVRAGQAAARLGPAANTRLDLDKAQRDAEVAEAAYQRELRLRASGLASDGDVEAAKAAAGSAAETAKSLRARTGGGSLTLVSPTAGVVEALPTAPGDAVAMGAPVLKIADPRVLRVRLGLEPSQALQIRPQAEVRLSGVQGGAQVEARVASLDTRADAQTRQASAVVQIPSGSGFTAGQSLRGEIAAARSAGALAVPRQALLYDGERPYVFVAAGGVAHRRDVSPGVEEDDRVEIKSGLKAGERVVVEGGSALSDGMAVREQDVAQRTAS